MRWPSLLSRVPFSKVHPANTRRGAARKSSCSLTAVEALESRQLLSATSGGHLTVSEWTAGSSGRFDTSLKHASDLTRYTAAELNSVREWIALTPEFFAWQAAGYRELQGSQGSGDSSWPGSDSATLGPMPTSTSPTSTTGGSTSTSTLASVDPIERFPGAELWTFPIEASWQSAAADLQAAVGAGHYYPLVGHKVSKKFVPNDPYYPQQWHLDNRRQSGGATGEDANVIEAWDSVRGTGIVIGIVDDGIDYYHPDLQGQYLFNLQADYDDFDNDAIAEALNEDFHGTAVAGVAAAAGNNNIGVSGVAPSASITGIRLISADNQTDNQEALALSHAGDVIDIYNNSWGPVDGVDWLMEAGPLAYSAIDQGVAFGRGGLGSIYTWAAGNGREDGDNTNYDGYANLFQVIAVAAIDDRGEQAEYSEPGAPILVSAPSASDGSGLTDGIVTTDLLRNQGYNYLTTDADDDPFRDLDYTGTFGGTSSATPVVSGVVALMLDANSNLGWRDVKAILIESARKNDPTDNSWITNGAGYEFSHKYGFGAVDAAAAVELAESWTPLGQGFFATTDEIFSGLQIPENTTGITSTFNVATDLVNIEYVEILVDIQHNYGGDLEIVLESPAGTRSTLATEHLDGTPYSDWWMSSNAFRGENTFGEWKLHVWDRDTGITGSLQSWGLNFYTGPDVAPVAVNDTAQTRPGVAVAVNVIANDAFRPDVNSVAIVGTPVGGTATVSTGGLIQFTPAAGFSGDATVQYTVESQGGLLSNVGTVTIVVNEPPTARADTVTTPEDIIGTFNVSQNDTDIDGTVVASTVQVTTAPAHGTATVDLQGRIVYTPALNYFGVDSLFYTIKDNRGGTSTPGAVTINITPVNDAPTPIDDTAKAVGGVPTVVSVLTNDFDVDSTVDPATVQIVTPPPDGSATVNPNGTITVTPPLGFAGLLTFTYAVRDNFGLLSQPATVRITTSAPPSTTADTLTINEDTPVTIDVLFNDFDVDGVIVRSTLAISQPPQHGTVTIDSGNRVRYVPTLNYFGTDTFRYTVRDNEGNTSAPGVVTITLIEVNDAPAGAQDAAGTNPGVGVVIDVLANDIDVDGTIQPFTLSIPVGGQPQHGTATTDPVTGAILYTPNAGYVGSDALTYMVRDEDGALSNETTVLLRVGRPVSFSGMVFADINNNGLLDAGEVGVPNAEVAAVMNAGLFKLNAIVHTENDGTFTISDRPSDGVVLPQGTYSLKQTQPTAFIDGSDTPGTPPPSSTVNNNFIGITLAAGEEATDFFFAERGLKAEFVSAYLGRRLYFASAAPDGSLFGARHGRVFDLETGDVYFTFDSGAPGRVMATAAFDVGSGSVRLDVLDANFNVLGSANSATGQASVAFGPGPGPYILRLAGSADNVFVSASTADPTSRVGATLSLRGSSWPAGMVEQMSTPNSLGSGLTIAPATLTGESVLPWSNVDVVTMKFDSHVSVGAASLRIASSNGEAYGVRNYVYDAISHTATWLLDRPLAGGNYVVSVVPANATVDFHLSTSTPAEARFTVLPGDVDGDGVVNYQDAIAVRNQMTPATYTIASPRFDLDANGVVDAADLLRMVADGFSRRSATEISGLMLANATTTPGSAPAAEAVVRRASGRGANVAAMAELRTVPRREREAAIDLSHADSRTGETGLLSAAALRANRARRLSVVAARDERSF